MIHNSLKDKLPTISNSKTVYTHKNCQVVLDTMQLPNEQTYEYISMNTARQAVMVLAVTAEGHFVLNEEYRHPTRKVLLSLPGGQVDLGELPQTAASREFFEETGYMADEYIYLGQAFPFPGKSPQETFYYLARGAKKVQEPTLEICEILETVEMSYEDLEKRVLDASNMDAHITTALYYKQLRGL